MRKKEGGRGARIHCQIGKAGGQEESVPDANAIKGFSSRRGRPYG